MKLLLTPDHISYIGRTKLFGDMLFLSLSGSGIAFEYKGAGLTFTLTAGSAGSIPGNDVNYARVAVYLNDERIIDTQLSKPETLLKITPPDPSKTTTTTTTTTDPNVTTTTTAYKFEIQKKSVTIPDKPTLAIGKEMQISITGAPNASLGGAVGFGTTADDWKNIEWKGTADKDGKLTVHVDLNEMPDNFKTCEVQVWWSNTWDAASEKATDQPYTIDSCEFHYLMGGALEPLWGDANCDGTVDLADAILIMQALANPDKYGENGSDKHHLTETGKLQADVDTNTKGLTGDDAVLIQEYLLKKVTTLSPFEK